jgi:hypothetical protein
MRPHDGSWARNLQFTEYAEVVTIEKVKTSATVEFKLPPLKAILNDRLICLTTFPKTSF